MWHLLALFVIAFAASEILDYSYNDYDNLDGYQKFMYVLVNIALYMALLIPVLMLIWIGVQAAKASKAAAMQTGSLMAGTPTPAM